MKQLADLSKLSLTDSEATALLGDFDSILGYIDQLREVTTTATETFTTINQMREDIVLNEAAVDDLLEQVPQRHNRYVKVQKIITQGNE